MARLSKRVRENNKLTTNTKISVYNACVVSTLLYGSEIWTDYAQQKHRLDSFHLRCLRRILGRSWQDRVQNTYIFVRQTPFSMFALLSQRRLHAMAGPHSSYGGWTANKRLPLRRAFHRLHTSWPPNTTLQRRLQESYEGCRDLPSHGKLLQTTTATGGVPSRQAYNYKEQGTRENNSGSTKGNEKAWQQLPPQHNSRALQ